MKYRDCITNKMRSQTHSIDFSDEDMEDFDEDKSLRKNVSIGTVAEAIRKSAKLCNDGKYVRSTEKLSKAIKFARKQFKADSDADVDRVVKLAKKRRSLLSVAIKKSKEEKKHNSKG